MKLLLLSLTLICFYPCLSQDRLFRFIHISDTHIGSPNGAAEEDLRRTVRDINQMKDIAFVVLTGDITELGTNEELRLAKQILDSLNVPWYIIPGNHDTGWSESGGLGFKNFFGYDKIQFDYAGIRFIGCASGPYLRMSDGHIPRDAILWLDSVLNKTPTTQPIIFFNHYPLDNGLDNWYEITDRLKKWNTILAICGHGHANRAMNFEGIPAVMGRSNLRARAPIGGFNIVDVRKDSILYSERRPGVETLPSWTGVKIVYNSFDQSKTFSRPQFSLNDQYNNVKAKWTHSSDANVISTPAVAADRVIFGNQNGLVVALSLQTGKKLWTFNTSGPVFSSPAAEGKKVVFGSADGMIYCLNTANGKLNWKFKTNASVLGAALIEHNTVYIGGSDHFFRAIDLNNGKEKWNFNGLTGPVMSTPVISGDKLIFGAWDRNLYALSKNSGELLWKWSNGSTVINYSPASCIPVIINNTVFVVAPDRYISAIDLNTGATLWRNNDAAVRESIGIAENGETVYGKTMQDTIVAYKSSRDKQSALWKMHVGFGYEHVPSMLIEKGGEVFFGTRNGVVYAIDPVNRKTIWAHKIDNSMVNTVRVLDKKNIIAATMDGKVVLLQVAN